MASQSDIAVSVRGLSKAYTIAHQAEKHNTLAETVLARLKNPFKRARTETFWALKDVSFEIKKGEVVGIIGRNGAGKSTLLKILSRITEPTKGAIDLYGRVGSLLEVGTGFHPELTGRENIYLNGAILGMSRREITKQFEAIIDFAGVEKFLDTPVKRYSSGMYVRLAFAVAAHLNTEILIVDEVLAVGDVEFQKKCLGKIEDVSASGRTVLFVSHNMNAVTQLCQEIVWISGGEIREQGSTRVVVSAYLSDQFMPLKIGSLSGYDRSTRGRPFYEKILVNDVELPGVILVGARDQVRVVLVGTAKADALRNFCAGIHIISEDGVHIMSFATPFSAFGYTDVDGTITLECNIPCLRLLAGTYYIDIGCSDDRGQVDYLKCVGKLTVEPPEQPGWRSMPMSKVHGYILADSEWSRR